MTGNVASGWKRPVCGRGNAPWKSTCDCVTRQRIVNEPECPKCHLTCFTFGCADPDCPQKPKVTCEIKP